MDRGGISVSFEQQSKVATVSPCPIEKPTLPVDILSNIYFKNNLRIDYKKRLTCFLFGMFVCVVVTALSEHNATNKWRYSGYKNNLSGTKGTFVV